MKIINPSRLVAAAALAVSFAFGAVAMASAQEIPPEKLALARKYVDLTNKQGLYEAMLVQAAASTSKLFSQSNPDISDKIDEVIGQVLETYKGKNDELFNQLARVYAVEFTVDELTQIVAFYSSPAGQTLAEKTQTVNAGIGAVLAVYNDNFGKEFVSKVRSALKAAGYNV